MGTIQSKQQLPNQKNFDKLDYGYCIVWRRKVDHLELMQEYPLSIQTEQRLKKYQNIWPLRTKHPLLVSIYYFSHSKSSNFCGELARGSVFTERVPFRLSQLWNIPLKQSVSIMKVSLEGYELLFESFGLFLVKSTMIGFTENMKTKIWLHTDFSQPQPQNPNCNNLQQMMIAIINSIENVQQYPQGQYLKFSQFLAEGNFYYVSKDFKLLLKGLDQYIIKMKIVLSNNLYDLHLYKRQPEGWEKFRMRSDYPKLLNSEKVQISKNSNNQGITILNKLNDMKQQKIRQENLRQQFYQVKSPIKYSHPMSGTNGRRNFQEKHSEQIHISNFPLLPNRHSQLLHKQENLKFWRSSQKTYSNVHKSPQTKRLSQNYQFNSPKSFPNQNLIIENKQQNNLLLMKKDSDSQNSVTNSNSRNSSSKMLQSIRSKYSEVSTTQNYDRTSNRSSFTLIQDLEINDRKNSSNLSIYNFKKKV